MTVVSWFFFIHNLNCFFVQDFQFFFSLYLHSAAWDHYAIVEVTENHRMLQVTFHFKLNTKLQDLTFFTQFVNMSLKRKL